MLQRYLDPECPLDERVNDLLSQMTLAEKLAQLGSAPITELVGESGLDVKASAALLGEGIGQIAWFAAGLAAIDSATYANEIQDYLRINTRLGIPALLAASDASDASEVRAFPQAIGLAATFAPALVRDMARALSAQLQGVGVRLAFTPVLDIATYGEDPYLAGRMAVACVRGLQGESLQAGVAAAAEHFLGYAIVQTDRDAETQQLGSRQLREVFAEPFAAAIRDADLAGVVCAKHSIDGLVCAASAALLTDLLRTELGFEGVVMGDSETLGLLIGWHKVAADKAEAAGRALAAGLDLEFPRADYFGEPLAGLIENGKFENEEIDIGLVNRAVRRVIRLKFRLGLFEQLPVEVAHASANVGTAAQRDLARRLATQSMVLLKNADAVLPIGTRTNSTRSNVRANSICVLGPAAEDANRVTPLAGISARAAARVSHAPGCEVDSENAAMLAAAVAAAQAANVAIVCLSVTNCAIPRAQRLLHAAVCATGTPVVTVVFGGRALQLQEIYERCAALLLAWLPGEEGGNALADLLFGHASPGGRLPVSLQRPELPFGYGLSYATFEYTQLTCPESVETRGVLRVAFMVTNTGQIDADEVVQLYGRDLVAEVARPQRQLIGFNRVSVPAGATVACKFRIDLSQFAYFNSAMTLVVEPGEIEILVGGSALHTPLRQTLRLTGATRELSQRQIVATQVTGP